MRVFVGLGVTPELGELIAQFQADPVFKSSLRPSRAESHITLKAPMEIDNPEPIIECVRKAGSRFKPARVELLRPGLITPFTLCLFAEPQPTLALQQWLAQNLAWYNTRGVNLHEDDFRPHLTIGRTRNEIRDAKADEIINLCQKAIPLPYRYEAAGIKIYGREGEAPYRILEEVRFSGS